jgi:hypothetical protein
MNVAPLPRGHRNGYHPNHRHYRYSGGFFDWAFPDLYEYPHDDYYVRCHRHRVRRHGHWVWRRYCRRYYY